MQEKKQYSYFCYIFFFQFVLIVDKANPFFSNIRINHAHVNFVRVKGCTVQYSRIKVIILGVTKIHQAIFACFSIVLVMIQHKYSMMEPFAKIVNRVLNTCMTDAEHLRQNISRTKQDEKLKIPMDI